MKREKDIRQYQLRFVENYKNLPCVCHQLPDDIDSEILCAPCTAREMERRL